MILVMVAGSALAVGKPKQAKRQTKDALLERYDVNHDNALDADEVTAVEKDFLDRFDKNGDKKLDKDELDAVRQELAQQAATNLRKKKK
jgi:Ca2+-binding EF-hand superfamily protein